MKTTDKNAVTDLGKALSVASKQTYDQSNATFDMKLGNDLSFAGRNVESVTDSRTVASDFMQDVQAQTRMIGDRCDKLVRSVQNRGWKVANDAGIPRDGCCLHNASIDEDLKHWCFESPGRLTAAKRATAIIEGAWAISDLRERITSRIWNKTTPPSWAKSPIRNDGRAVNVKLLFGQV